MKIIQGNALTILKTMDSESVDCVVTSPPYFGLRDYQTGQWQGGDPACDHLAPRNINRQTPGSKQATNKASNPITENPCRKCGAIRKDEQIGLEKTPDEYVQNLVAICREIKRVLKSEGTFWLNLGDTYSEQRWSNNKGTGFMQTGKNAEKCVVIPRNSGLPRKNLIGIPWRVALSLQKPYYTGKIKDEKDRTWLAAMIDGEGRMFIHKRKVGQNNGQGYTRKSDTYGAGLEIANTHESIIKRCQEITGMGSICRVERETKNKMRNLPLYRWNMRSNECRNIVREVYPYLIRKKKEARLLLGCPSSGEDAKKAHESLIALHNGKESIIDFPEPESLYESGWILRQDIIWSKNNPMPESVTDRCTKAHEYIFLLAKSERYYFDHKAIQEPANYDGRKDTRMKGSEKYKNAIVPGKKEHTGHARGHERWQENEDGLKVRNKRSVWSINVRPFKGAHYATFPEALIEPIIKAGCPELVYDKNGAPHKGIVFDPFMGSGTTALVAEKLGRDWIGIELNPKHIEMIKERIRTLPQPLFR